MWSMKKKIKEKGKSEHKVADHFLSVKDYLQAKSVSRFQSPAWLCCRFLRAKL